MFGGATPVAATLPTTPYDTGASDLVQLTVNELWGDITPELITRDIAQRVPGLKRALGVHLSVIGKAVFREYTFDALVDPQPAWLTSTASGVSPYLRKIGLTSDLFWWGWACLGAELGPDDQIADAVHIPFGLWSIDQNTGEVTIDDKIEARYRERPIVIPLGLNGVLIDGIDTIRAARFLEAAHLDRIGNPIAQTELHINDPSIRMNRKEKLKLAKAYNEGRQLKGGATSVTDNEIDVKIHGQVATDLFESGRNAIRLDLANHAYVPASIIEGAKNGSASEIEYNNASTERNGLLDFGTALFVNAIEARLSMDDVCAPGNSIRGDLANYTTVPTPAISPALED
jgi:hypothetical protein